MKWSDLSKFAKIAGISAIAGFFLRLGSSQQSIQNDVVLFCRSVDYGALACGALAAAFGIMGLIGAVQAKSNVNMAICAGAAAIGVLHLLRGLGYVTWLTACG